MQHPDALFPERSRSPRCLHEWVADCKLRPMPDSQTSGEFDPVSRLDLRLLGGFSVAVDGVELAAERWPSLRAASWCSCWASRRSVV